MGRTRKKRDVDVGYYAVAFIDLMGQQEKLRRLTSVPDRKDSPEYGELINSLKNTYGAVTGMRKIFRQYFESFGKMSIDTKNMPKDKRSIVKGLNNNPIKFHQFSDFVVAFLSLSTAKGSKLPIRGIHGILGATAATSLISLAAGHPVRGGIDIGVGIEIKYDEIYGSPLARAYALESHIAGYPRVVIGDELSQYLIDASKLSEQDEISAISSHIAKMCMDYIAIDDDGYPFVDFIGQCVHDQIGEDEVVKELVKRAYDFVIKSSVEFQEKKNSKIAFKYTLLRNYIESRLPIWGIHN